MSVLHADPRADPRAPRERDRARAVPIGGDLVALDDAKIFAAPDDPRDRDAWRAELHRWRDDARRRLAYDGRRYDDPAGLWTQECFSLGLAWLWDERLYDRSRHAFTPDALLAADPGGVECDAVILWHTYPVIGIDERDQFDLLRDVRGLADLVRTFHDRGVRVLVEYQEWDRRAGRDDARELLALVQMTGVDGIFLDAAHEAPAAVRDALATDAPAVMLESESNVPLARIADHAMSWAQWQDDSAAPGVLRAKWFEARHMVHGTRRWDRDRTPQLRTAWLNGAGMLVWENVFGSWVGWNARDRSAWRTMRRVAQHVARHFSHGAWTPLADVGAEDALFASRFDLGRQRLWTVFTRGARPLGRDQLTVDARDGERWFELATGTELVPHRRGATARIALPRTGRPFAAVLALPSGEVGAELRDLLASSRADDASDDARFPERPVRRIAAPGVTGARVPEGMIRVAGGARALMVRYRLRETGMYGSAPFVDAWKPLPPLLHRAVEEEHMADLAPFAIGRTEVTNAEFGRFLDATGYRPADPDRFLAHWEGSLTRPGTGDEPVRYVDLDDARAFAAWAGARLPTEHEWQAAAASTGFVRGEPLVWNWTESEHTDGRTRFTILKGGSHVRSEGSEWYADGGPQPPEVSFKFLRGSSAVERSSAIGFRIALGIGGR